MGKDPESGVIASNDATAGLKDDQIITVVGKGVGIDIDFPTNAAAVLAPVCYALKAFVICRGVKFHRGSFLYVKILISL